MAWGDPTSLKFDIDEISNMRQKIKETATDLADFKNRLIQAINDLKANWQTPAGQKFSSEVNTDWATQVDQYIKIINAVDELLEVAESNYQEVQDQVDALSF